MAVVVLDAVVVVKRSGGFFSPWRVLSQGLGSSVAQTPGVTRTGRSCLGGGGRWQPPLV